VRDVLTSRMTWMIALPARALSQHSVDASEAVGLVVEGSS